MSENLSNKIAAGEVIESLMNVVKELVENSIDAKATTIKVELKEAGLKSIRVTDDGIGMDHDDALKCFYRHATSKLYNDDDLFNIKTLGFRGEAIPSIASVSKMTIKTSDGTSGTEIVNSGGNIISVDDSDLRVGTIITVEDIFYNTPARLKYLKSSYTELANITNYLNKMALSNPNIKFILKNDDKEILNTFGNGNLLKVINCIYGLEVTKKMAYIKTSNNDYDVDGYISYPEINRSSKNFITILVNGRSVRSNEINRSILDAYHTYLFHDRYPIVILNIKADPSIIDVNIHPSKMEVKFSKINDLKDLIFNEISRALKKLVLIPEVKYTPNPISNIDSVSTIDDKKDFISDVVKPSFEEISFDFDVAEEQNVYNEEPEEKKEKFKKITPLALIHGTYIIGENEEGMYIIDQHAANERINYEYYKKELGKSKREVVDLLVPLKLEFSKDEYIILKERFSELDKLNIGYEEFGMNTIIVRSHPSFIKKDYALESLRKIIEIIISNNDFSLEKFNEKIAITLACKMSIKANQHITIDDMTALLERLRKTDNPFTCPHGRPTIITYSIYELQKMFKRVE